MGVRQERGNVKGTLPRRVRTCFLAMLRGQNTLIERHKLSARSPLLSAREGGQVVKAALAVDPGVALVREQSQGDGRRGAHRDREARHCPNESSA